MKVNITIPDSWKDITLKKYLELQNDLESYKDDEEAQAALLLYHLCGLNATQTGLLNKTTYDELISTLSSFMQKQEVELQRFVVIDGVEHGFEPNLSNMSYGAYADITKFNQLAIDKNWGKIMSILYRPVVSKKKETYLIQQYDGKIDDKMWMNVGMDIHFGALFFFVHTLRDLLIYTLNYTMKMEGLTPELKQTLAKSGQVMQQLLNLQEEISKK